MKRFRKLSNLNSPCDWGWLYRHRSFLIIPQAIGGGSAEFGKLFLYIPRLVGVFLN